MHFFSCCCAEKCFRWQRRCRSRQDETKNQIKADQVYHEIQHIVSRFLLYCATCNYIFLSSLSEPCEPLANAPGDGGKVIRSKEVIWLKGRSPPPFFLLTVHITATLPLMLHLLSILSLSLSFLGVGIVFGGRKKKSKQAHTLLSPFSSSSGPPSSRTGEAKLGGFMPHLREGGKRAPTHTHTRTHPYRIRRVLYSACSNIGAHSDVSNDTTT